MTKLLGRVPFMRTLYVRMIAIIITILLASAIIGFVGSNVYYHYFLKPKNDAKITHMAKQTVAIYEEGRNEDIDTYLSTLTALGYQFYLADHSGKGRFFGPPFRKENITDSDVRKVLSGQTYHGIGNYPWKLFVTGFFDNELRNTIGVPIQVNGEQEALFVRPNTVVQFGEMRIFLAVLLVAVLLLSFLLIFISMSFIVKPIKKLTEATKKIAEGNYHLKLNEKRKDEIGHLARNFTRMSESLEKTEEKRQEFVSNVSHEIQSPLTSIQGFSQALREDDLPKELHDHYLTIIENESRRMSELSRQLLTLSFLDSAMEAAEKVSLDVSEQLQEVVMTTKWQWQQKDLAVELDTVSTQTKADPKMLQQVWMNIFTNAIHYTEAGGSITIQCQDKKHAIQVLITDTGVGIATEDMDHLFERFYKADKARVRSHESTGLGLSIAKKIIELHDGSIEVNSELGKGTCFIVTLPKITEPKA